MYKSPVLFTIIFCVMLIGFLPGSLTAGDLDREKNYVERDVTLDEVPEAVKTAILEAAGAHKIRELEEVTGPDGVVYEAEWMVDGKEVEIEVAPDGTILEGGDEEDDSDDVDDDDGEDDDDKR